MKATKVVHSTEVVRGVCRMVRNIPEQYALTKLQQESIFGSEGDAGFPFCVGSFQHSSLEIMLRCSVQFP